MRFSQASRVAPVLWQFLGFLAAVALLMSPETESLGVYQNRGELDTQD